ncbi:CLUMA_CG007562, isoform A [Clunio marinus]|uniref:CLUMA_CG007562, isoform A n=1 Tax=Clunio marinus TaxID=568069 RepID=A0A1J1I549_9DIPT|nr:CLUMA_CG007562, isoform A [Clunio marinus]
MCESLDLVQFLWVMSSLMNSSANLNESRPCIAHLHICKHELRSNTLIVFFYDDDEVAFYIRILWFKTFSNVAEFTQRNFYSLIS